MKTNNGLSLLSDAWSPMSDLRREFDWALKTNQDFVPPCEVEEASDHFLLTIEMPGFKREDIKLEVKEGHLSLSGERRMETKQSQDRQWYSERSFGKFQRSFALPRGVDVDKIDAGYQDGILRITIPKAESWKPRQIKISVA